MKKVSKCEILEFVKDKNLTYTAHGDFPYTGLWKDKSGNIVAKEIPVGRHFGINSDKYEYYITN